VVVVGDVDVDFGTRRSRSGLGFLVPVLVLLLLLQVLVVGRTKAPHTPKAATNANKSTDEEDDQNLKLLIALL